MFIVNNFIYATATILDMVLSLYMWIIIARAIISWVSPFSRNPIIYALVRLTEPVLCEFAESFPCEEWLLIFPHHCHSGGTALAGVASGQNEGAPSRLLQQPAAGRLAVSAHGG
jgi:hypothetical protein